MGNTLWAEASCHLCQVCGHLAKAISQVKTGHCLWRLEADGSYNVSLDWLPLAPGMLRKRYKAHGGQPLLVWGLWTFETFYKCSQRKPNQVTRVEEVLEKSQPGKQMVWGGVLGNHQGGVNGLTQVNGKPRFDPCRGWVDWVGGALNKVTMVPASTSVPRESCLHPTPPTLILIVSLVPPLMSPMLSSCYPCFGA